MFNHLQRYSLQAILAGLIFCTPLAGFGQAALKEEARTAKLTQDLLEVQQKEKSKNLRQAASPSDDIGLVKVDRTQVHDGLIAIEAVANDPDGQALMNDLKALGLQESRYYKRIVFGYFPIDKLSTLRSVSTLHVARPAYTAFKNVGKTTSQGDAVMLSNVARNQFNVTGVGSKIGVMSDSYDALKGAAAGVASGDLPADVQVVADIPARYNATASDEGRAMAEIVHDVAPGAKIAFATAYETEVDFALNIIALAQSGCNIIVDDIIYLAEPFFQDGIVAQAVDYVSKNWNVTYFSSAGNNDRQSYSRPFFNSGKTPPSSATFKVEGQAHDFIGTIFQRVTIAPGGEFFPIFQWSDSFYSQTVQSGGVSGAQTDMDIFVYYNGVLQPQLSSYENNIGSDPLEAIDIVNTTKSPITIEVAYVKYAGPNPSLIKWVDFGYSASVTPTNQSSTLYGHANAKSAIAVGAAAWFQTPAYNATRYPTPVIESYSSAGGTPILYTTYGAPIPAEVRLKPEITAPDGGNTTFFGQQLNDGDTFPNFFGTSAAAPHAAAVAALLQEKAKNTMSSLDILRRMQSTAIDMDDPSTPGFDTGFDFGTGFGFIQADKILTFGTPLAILKPEYDCATQRLTIRTSGGDGTPITFAIPGVRRTSPTSTTGIVENGVVQDSRFIEITAYQSGQAVTYAFSLNEYCPSTVTARAGIAEPGTGLQVSVLGNPIPTDWAEVEVRGAQGQPIKLQVNNTLGGVTSSKSVELIESVERHKVLLGRTPGLYFLQVTTPTETKTIKVVRQ